MRCERRDQKPAWWLLYVINVALVGLIGLIETACARRRPAHGSRNRRHHREVCAHAPVGTAQPGGDRAR